MNFTRISRVLQVVCLIILVAGLGWVNAQSDEFNEGDKVLVAGVAQVVTIYAEPSTDSAILEATVSGVTLTIAGGSEKTSEGLWWQVTSPLGNKGWLLAELNGKPILQLVDQKSSTHAILTPVIEIAASPNVESSSGQIGDSISVLGDLDFVLVYQDSSESAAILEAVTSGTKLAILAEPRLIDDVEWWNVRTPSGANGWIPSVVDGKRVLSTPGGVVVSGGLIEIGSKVTVFTETYLLIHQNASESSDVLEAAVKDIKLEIIGGPEIVDNETWWQVRSITGNEGWVLQNIDGKPVLYPDGSLLPQTPTPMPTATPLPTETPSPTPIVCPGSLPANLLVGERARVTPGKANNLRNRATIDGGLLDQIPSGDTMMVVGGPECADGYTWWKVEYRGRTGWTAQGDNKEYWLEPVLTG
ncbi:MAG: SH3 domain-containing protein [Anaerolineaceae bacterium]|nr:SH3 domain-containing protein [Anaerolineaceae bacterium]